MAKYIREIWKILATKATHKVEMRCIEFICIVMSLLGAVSTAPIQMPPGGIFETFRLDRNPSDKSSLKEKEPSPAAGAESRSTTTTTQTPAETAVLSTMWIPFPGDDWWSQTQSSTLSSLEDVPTNGARCSVPNSNFCNGLIMGAATLHLYANWLIWNHNYYEE